jgi:NADPH-dependent glutamate synthase beta subunit-like oxidoreductase
MERNDSMRLEDATNYTAKCFNGEPASCSYACPFHLDLRSFMDKAAKGKWSSAYKTLRNAVVFPAIVAALCPEPCRDHCQRKQIGDEALMVATLSRPVSGSRKTRSRTATRSRRKIKASPLSARVPRPFLRAILAGKRYRVVVFEKEAGWGGALRAHDSFADLSRI